MFQLTTSRRGRHQAEHGKRSELCFNSRPHEEVDFPSTSPYSLLVVSTHDLTKRSTSKRGTLLYLKEFQLTTSRRGRRSSPSKQSLPSFKFQLTTSRRGRRLRYFFLAVSYPFQLTTSRRGRQIY